MLSPFRMNEPFWYWEAVAIGMYSYVISLCPAHLESDSAVSCTPWSQTPRCPAQFEVRLCSVLHTVWSQTLWCPSHYEVRLRGVLRTLKSDLRSVLHTLKSDFHSFLHTVKSDSVVSLTLWSQTPHSAMSGKPWVRLRVEDEEIFIGLMTGSVIFLFEFFRFFFTLNTIWAKGPRLE